MNKTALAFKQWSGKSEKRLSSCVEGAILEFTECISARMEQFSVSKTNLAHKLKCSPSYITKVLQGSTNFTVESMAKIAFALNCELTIGLKPKGPFNEWRTFDFSARPAVNLPSKEWVWKQRGSLTEHKSEFSIQLPNDRPISITT